MYPQRKVRLCVRDYVVDYIWMKRIKRSTIGMSMRHEYAMCFQLGVLHKWCSHWGGSIWLLCHWNQTYRKEVLSGFASCWDKDFYGCHQLNLPFVWARIQGKGYVQYVPRRSREVNSLYLCLWLLATVFAPGTNRSSRVIITGEAIDFDVKWDSIEWRTWKIFCRSLRVGFWESQGGCLRPVTDLAETW